MKRVGAPCQLLLTPRLSLTRRAKPWAGLDGTHHFASWCRESPWVVRSAFMQCGEAVSFCARILSCSIPPAYRHRSVGAVSCGRSHRNSPWLRFRSSCGYTIIIVRAVRESFFFAFSALVSLLSVRDDLSFEKPNGGKIQKGNVVGARCVRSAARTAAHTAATHKLAPDEYTHTQTAVCARTRGARATRRWWVVLRTQITQTHPRPRTRTPAAA